MIAEHASHFRHVSKRLRFDLRRAASHPHPRIRAALMCLANGLPGLADRLIGHGTAIDNDNVVMASKLLSQGVALGKIKAAAHADDFRFLQWGVHPKSSQFACPVKT